MNRAINVVVFVIFIHMAMTEPIYECNFVEDEGFKLYPHPMDCTKYYSCEWGIAKVLDCPKELNVIDVEFDVCYSRDSRCRTTTTIITTSLDEATIFSHPDETETTHDNEYSHETETDHDHDHSDETGTTHDHDHSHQTETTHDHDHSHETETIHDPTPTELIPTSTDSSAVTPLSPDVICPPVHEENATLLPKPGDCTSFYYCVWGTPVFVECPEGLHFNPTLNGCDWPIDAGCDSSLINPTTESQSATEEHCEHCSEHHDDELHHNCNGSCPKHDEELYPSYLSYRGDCTKFCKCSWGTPYEFYCPSTLHFNLRLNVCDWPKDAGCE